MSLKETYTVRWSDKDGAAHQKTYRNEAEARRAKKYLLENGAPSVDIAVRINDKQIGMLKDARKQPVESNEFLQKGIFEDD